MQHKYIYIRIPLVIIRQFRKISLIVPASYERITGILPRGTSVEQLSGTIEPDHNAGTAFTIVVNEKE
jgi:hypothetical protein